MTAGRLPTSDAQLRALERRFQESRDPDDEAAWLLQRVRVGALERLRLELAAQCGHEGARRAVGAAPGRPFTDLPPEALPLLLELLAGLADTHPRARRLAMALAGSAVELGGAARAGSARDELLVTISGAIARAKRLARRPRDLREAGAGSIFAGALQVAQERLEGSPTPAAVRELDEALRTTTYRAIVSAALLV